MGIPRALLFYELFPLWREFFTSLGCEVITSQPTSKETLNAGASAAVDETCLPIKIMYGHILELQGKCDFIFLPRLVSIEPNSYICPKFMGLPDIVRGLGVQGVIEPTVDLRNPKEYWQRLWQAAVEIEYRLGIYSPTRVASALFRGLLAERGYRARLHQGYLPWEALDSEPLPKPSTQNQVKIGVIGHPYTMFDQIINMNLFELLRLSGYGVLTPVNHEIRLLNRIARQLPKDLFWTYGRRMIGAARLWYQRKLVDGIIHIVSFGCGTDSLTGDLIERLTKRESDIPFMLLTVDEHTGEAGFRTRVEAFLDMIQFRAAGAGRSGCQ
ncbi:MAG: hypothetical protein H0Z38_08565 [Firmicutes bacterium]|nr:hypothetical protein [Bacillota bacterium]